MNRTELIESVAARTGSDHAAARRHVDAVFDAIMENVAAGERVLVTGFGTFDRLSRPARTARNPRNGLPVDVPAAEIPRFRIGQTFKQRVALGGAEPTEPTEPAEPMAAVQAAKPSKASKTPKKSKKATAAEDGLKDTAKKAAKKSKSGKSSKGKTKKASKSR